MNRCADFETINGELLARIPEAQLHDVFAGERCDIDPEFLGFVDIYKHLSAIIPRHFTVVDLGCAYAPQAFLFESHKAYIGVDFSDCKRFKSTNTEHYNMSIAAFLKAHGHLFKKETTFGICSYVPPWGGDNIRLAREFFTNVFTFYPHGSPAPEISL